MSGYFYHFLFFFKVNSGVFLHNRVVTLVAVTRSFEQTRFRTQPDVLKITPISATSWCRWPCPFKESERLHYPAI